MHPTLRWLAERIVVRDEMSSANEDLLAAIPSAQTAAEIMTTDVYGVRVGPDFSGSDDRDRR